MALNIQEIIQNIMEVQRRKPPLPGSVNKCLTGKCPVLCTFFKVFSNMQHSQICVVFWFFFFLYIQRHEIFLGQGSLLWSFACCVQSSSLWPKYVYSQNKERVEDP